MSWEGLGYNDLLYELRARADRLVDQGLVVQASRRICAADPVLCDGTGLIDRYRLPEVVDRLGDRARQFVKDAEQNGTTLSGMICPACRQAKVKHEEKAYRERNMPRLDAAAYCSGQERAFRVGREIVRVVKALSKPNTPASHAVRGKKFSLWLCGPPNRGKRYVGQALGHGLHSQAGNPFSTIGWVDFSNELKLARQSRGEGGQILKLTKAPSLMITEVGHGEWVALSQIVAARLNNSRPTIIVSAQATKHIPDDYEALRGYIENGYEVIDTVRWPAFIPAIHGRQDEEIW